jgi:hypothetical protein
MVLTVKDASSDNGAKIIQESYHGQGNQIFLPEAMGGGYFRLVAQHSGKVLDVRAASKDNWAEIQQWDWGGGDNQLFSFEPLDDGHVRIIAKHSGKVLDVSGYSTQAGAQIIQWAWHGYGNQRWLVPIADVPELNWTEIGTGKSNLVTTRDSVLGISSQDGSLAVFNGNPENWKQVATAAHCFVGNEDGVYQISAAKDAVSAWAPLTGNWTVIGGAMESLIVGAHTLFGIKADGTAWMYQGTPNQWLAIGGPYLDLEATTKFCFAISADGQRILALPLDSMNWNTIGQLPLVRLDATGRALYGVDASGKIWRYSGSGTTWSQIGGPYASMVAGTYELYALTMDKLAVMVFREDLGGIWLQAAGAADSIYLGDNYIFGLQAGTVVMQPMNAIPAGPGHRLRALGTSAPPQPHNWLFVFRTKDQIAAGYDGSVYVTLGWRREGHSSEAEEWRLPLTSFERGRSYSIPHTLRGTSLTSFSLVGEHHYLPDHWTLGTVSAWSISERKIYDYNVDADVPNDNDSGQHNDMLYLRDPSIRLVPELPNIAYVYIWQLRFQDKAVGHASILLSDGTTYISWWPSGVNAKLLPLLDEYYSTPHIKGRSYEADVADENGREPDLVLPICNLDEAAIKAWWSTYDGDEANLWVLSGANCSATVYQALERGGAIDRLTTAERDMYCEIHNQGPLPFTAWTPGAIADLVMILATKPSAPR